MEPREFSYIYDAYNTAQTSRYKDEWERMRMLACITIQPHVKNRINPSKLLELPWEKKARMPKTASQPVSREEAIKRFEARLKKTNGFI